MRFFSNDRDSRDDQPRADQPAVDVQERAADENADQAHDNHPERVASDPVAVPQQRAGSPWSSTPDGTVEPAGTDRTDDPDRADDPRQVDDINRVDDTDRTDDTDRVDGTGPADADLADRERRDGVDDDPDALRRDDSEVRHDGDSLVADDDATHRTSETQPVDLALDDDADARERREDTTPPDHAVADTAPDAVAGTSADDTDRDHTDGTTTTYGPDGTVTETPAAAPTTDDVVFKDEGGFDDPQAVDPDTDQPVDQSDAAAPVVATDSKPGAVAAPELGPIFAAADAKALQERWRDVQLRFVDSPREATAEAAGLVDEALDKLTASLRSQKDALTGDNGEDTEKLRVELRGYRDILNRVLGL